MRKHRWLTAFFRVEVLAFVQERSEIKRNEEKFGRKVRTVYCLYLDTG